tara:strand:+ start:731 stop:1051 length:321 start_codon:yes stop_codon:yes gene_type:complete
MDELRVWLAERKPQAPEELHQFFHLEFPQNTSVGESLQESVLHHLKETLKRLGRDREGALHLLAADALLTYACEVASSEEDTEDVLVRLIEILHPDSASSITFYGS